jgi:RNA polymerase sigma-70 factor (ECF subfamily)
MKNFKEPEKLITRALKSNLSDAELMSLLAQGRMESLGELYMRYGGMVRTLLWRLLPDESAVEAEDLCHDVFITVYKTAPRFQYGRELRPWLFGIAVRKARSWRRKNWVRAHLLKRFTQEDQTLASAATDSPDSATATRDQVDLAVSTLPHGQREVLVLYFTENLSGQQIADTLGIPLNTVWTRLRRARLAMRAALLDRPYTDKPKGAR